MHEARYQFLEGLKNVYNNFIHQNRITSDTFLMLLGSVNMDLDEANKRMHSWEYISSGLLKHWYITLLFGMREYPLIGKFTTLLMHNHIFNAFEVTIAFIQVTPCVNRPTKKQRDSSTRPRSTKRSCSTSSGKVKT